jgi:hypothetical protein
MGRRSADDGGTPPPAVDVEWTSASVGGVVRAVVGVGQVRELGAGDRFGAAESLVGQSAHDDRESVDGLAQAGDGVRAHLRRRARRP